MTYFPKKLAGLVCLSAASLCAQNANTNLIALWTADSLGTANGASIASVTDSVSGIVASQATSSKQPTMVFNAPGFGGHKAMRFWATNQQTLDIASGMSIANKSSYSVFVVGRPATVDNGASAAIVSVGGATQGIWYINFHGQFGYFGDQGDIGTTGANIPSRPTLIGMSSSGSSIIFHTAESNVTAGSFGNAGVLTGGHIGSNGTQYWANIDIAEVRVYSPAIASADLTALRAYVNTTYGAAATARRVVIAEGNSITEGLKLAIGEQTWPSQFSDQLRGDVRVYNVGISGETTTDMLTNAPTIGIPLCSQTSAEAFLWEGTNDLTIYDAPTSFGHMMSLAALYKAGGCSVLIGTTVKAGQLSGANETARAAYNASLLAQQTYPVIDLAALSQFSDSTNLTYYNADGTHLTAAGDGVVARAVLAAMNDYGTQCLTGSMAGVNLK